MRIAIVKLSSLGDVLHALPVAHALRSHFPRAHLAWIVEARESTVLKDQPDLDAVVPVDTRLWRRLIWRPAGAREVVRKLSRLTARLHGARFDVAIDLQGLIKSGLLTAYTGAPVRIGFALSHCWEPLNALFTTHRIRPPHQAVHVVEQYLSLLEPLGVSAALPVFRLPPDPEAERRIDEFLAAEGVKPRDRLVALNPGAGHPTKRWPLDHFARLAERLHEEAGVRVLLLWGPEEEGMARAIGARMTSRPLLAPPTTLPELSALLRRSTLMVAGDTGPLHLAAALGTPCVGLYGPTRAERNGPYGAHCRSLQSPNGMLAGIAPDEVLRVAQELLE